jgi:hypothetical protein
VFFAVGSFAHENFGAVGVLLFVLISRSFSGLIGGGAISARWYDCAIAGCCAGGSAVEQGNLLIRVSIKPRGRSGFWWRCLFQIFRLISRHVSIPMDFGGQMFYTRKLCILVNNTPRLVIGQCWKETNSLLWLFGFEVVERMRGAVHVH